MKKQVLAIIVLLSPLSAHALLSEIYCEEMYKDPKTFKVVSGARLQLSMRENYEGELNLEILAADHSTQHAYRRPGYRCSQWWDFQKEGKERIECRFTPQFPQTPEHFIVSFPVFGETYAKVYIEQRDDPQLCDNCDGDRPYKIVRKFDLGSCHWK